MYSSHHTNKGNIVANVENTETVKNEVARVNGTVPKDLYDELFEGERWDLRLDKSQYLVHILETYRQNLAA